MIADCFKAIEEMLTHRDREEKWRMGLYKVYKIEDSGVKKGFSNWLTTHNGKRNPPTWVAMNAIIAKTLLWPVLVCPQMKHGQYDILLVLTSDLLKIKSSY